MRLLSTLKIAAILILSASLTCCRSVSSGESNIKVLILSGSNNHDWKRTGPALQGIFESKEGFQVELTNQPDTLTFNSLKKFDVLVNNWNSWPETEKRWPESTEEGLLKFIHQGGGFVTFHASSSTFYPWEEFRDISTASWEEDTYHGQMCAVHVEITSADHPITRGLSDFYIFDELWMDARSNEKFTSLASAKNANADKTSAKKQPAVLVTDYGAGRIFHTILGHDARTMRNTGFETLLTRGTEWAATGQVKSAVPQEMTLSPEVVKDRYHWIENDSVLALYNQEEIIWQYNFRNKYGKPYFHPVYLGKTRLTCLGPEDHLWHVGQWFSWKFINGINYWEYQGDGYHAEGVTEIANISLTREADFSATIELEIHYHPPGDLPVLKEKRTIRASAPDKKSLIMDYKFEFEALSDTLILDRTPIPGEAGGQSWGGYSGLSLRFNQDFMEAGWISPGQAKMASGSEADWLFMGFTGLHGEKVGSAMFISEQTGREDKSWYLTNDPDLPFYYFSPACLYQAPRTLLKGEAFKLEYRISHHLGTIHAETLEKKYQEYIKP